MEGGNRDSNAVRDPVQAVIHQELQRLVEPLTDRIMAIARLGGRTPTTPLAIRRTPLPLRTAAALTAASYANVADASPVEDQAQDDGAISALVILIFLGLAVFGAFALACRVLSLVRTTEKKSDPVEEPGRTREAMTQSQVTCTTVMGHTVGRFRPLAELNQGVWRDGMRCVD